MNSRRVPKCVLLLATSIISTEWMEAAGLDYLAANARAVVVGSVETRTETPTEVSFDIHVARLFSGNLPNPVVSVIHPWSRGKVLIFPQIAQSIKESLYGMWFLTQDASGRWDVLISRPGRDGVFGLFLPASLAPPTGLYQYPAGTPLVDALTYELAAGVQSTNEDPAIFYGAFYSMDTVAVRSVLAANLASTNPSAEAIGLAGSLERGIPGSIQQLARLWPGISGDSHASYVVAALRDSWRGSAGTDLQQLVSIATGAAPGSKLRSAAVRSLAAVHTKEAIPFLGSLLSSADSTEQERAVYGLAAFANGCPMQTGDDVVSMAYLQCKQSGPYATAETMANFGLRPGTPEQQAPLVTYWQNWWNNHPELH